VFGPAGNGEDGFDDMWVGPSGESDKLPRGIPTQPVMRLTWINPTDHSVTYVATGIFHQLNDSGGKHG
jgi:hypothetical protein